MKKNLLFTLVLLSVFCMPSLSAQSGFRFVKTSYVGALDADAAKDWTKGWTNFDPKTTTYPAPTDTTTLNGMLTSLPVRGERFITSNLTLDATKVYLLKGFIVVKSGAKLTIPAGTVIRATADLATTPKNYATLVVERGAQIEITGTAANPVVFTSAKDAGKRERADWGGLVICGRGIHNLLNGTTNNNVQLEGFNKVTFDPSIGFIGGTDNTDNSGIIRYLRLEFGGLAFDVNQEINGLTLGAVGSATEVRNVQVSFSNDDSFEWFGGAVNSNNLIAFKGTDDDFDTDNGYSGLNQFGIAIRDSAYYDGTYALPSGASTSEGFESDNEATGTASLARFPFTSAVFSNYTMVGPVPVGTTYSQLNSVARAAFRRGARIRRNSSLRIVNTIFMGYRNFLMIDGDSCVRNTNLPAAYALTNPNTAVDVQKKQIFFTNNLIVNTAAASSPVDSTANGLLEFARVSRGTAKFAAVNAGLRQTGPLANNINPVAFTAGTVLVNPLASSTAPDFRPVAGSPALAGANFDNNPILVNLTTSLREIQRALAAANPVYPNPVSANGVLNFGKQVVSYGIFNINGQLIRYGFEADHATLEGLEKGMYIVKFEDHAQRFIVQ